VASGAAARIPSASASQPVARVVPSTKVSSSRGSLTSSGNGDASQTSTVLELTNRVCYSIWLWSSNVCFWYLSCWLLFYLACFCLCKLLRDRLMIKFSSLDSLLANMVASPHVWNSLPANETPAPLLLKFRSSTFTDLSFPHLNLYSYFL